jgi:hypothetical protein
VSAVLTVEFDIRDSADDEIGKSVGQTTVNFILTDERSKKRVGVNVAERTFAQG